MIIVLTQLNLGKGHSLVVNTTEGKSRGGIVIHWTLEMQGLYPCQTKNRLNKETSKQRLSLSNNKHAVYAWEALQHTVCTRDNYKNTGSRIIPEPLVICIGR